MPDNPVTLEEARAAVDRAVRAFAALKHDNPYVLGWAVSYEWTSEKLEKNEEAGRNAIVMDSQSISMTRGLFDGAKDFF